MAEEILFGTEQSMDRGEIASYLRQIADRLDSDGSLTLSAGGESVTLDVPGTPTFEIKAERETEGSETELSVEFELEWTEGESDGGSGGDGLRID